MAPTSQTIGSALETAVASIDRTDAVYLLCFATRRKRAFLAAFGEQPLTYREKTLFETLVASRAMGVPVAYLVNNREFYGRDFYVDGRVLIPRPETETLVETALARLPSHPKAAQPARVLDVGTGSGIIGITLALERPATHLVATDVSATALDTARENAARHSLAEPRWQGRVGATFEPVAGECFDVIVSNPPYIGGGDRHLTQGDLRFEPTCALTDGSADGLATLRALAAGCRAHLVSGGWLLVEHGYNQAALVRKLFEEAGLSDVFSEKDLAGIERVTGGQLIMSAHAG